MKRFWETVAVTPHSSSVRAYALAEISVEDFEKAKRDCLARLNNNTEMRKILREVGKKQRDRILGRDNDDTKSNNDNS